MTGHFVRSGAFANLASPGLVLGAVAVLLLGFAPAAVAAPSRTAQSKIIITGRVTDASTKRPLAQVCVRLVGVAVTSIGEACPSGVTTNSRGKFRIVVATVASTAQLTSVEVTPPSTDLFHLPVTVGIEGDGQGPYVANAALPAVGALTGRVLDQEGEPVQDVCPEVRGASADAPDPVVGCSGADGLWRLGRMGREGVAVALLTDNSRLTSSYVPAGRMLSSAYRFEPVPGRLTSLPDTVLHPGTTVTVTTNGTGGGRNHLTLVPRKSRQDLFSDRIVSDEVDAEAPVTLHVSNVPADDYDVWVENNWPSDDCDDDTTFPCRSLATWYAPGVADPALAEPVSVGEQPVELQANLEPFHALFITFRGQPNGAQVAVEVFFPSGQYWEYGVADLPPTPVKLRFTATMTDGQVLRWWYGGSSFSSALAVPPTTLRLKLTWPSESVARE